MVGKYGFDPEDLNPRQRDLFFGRSAVGMSEKQMKQTLSSITPEMEESVMHPQTSLTRSLDKNRNPKQRKNEISSKEVL